MTFALTTLANTPVVGPWSAEMILIAIAMAGALTFVALYPILSDFRRWTREGWHMWLFTVGLVSLGGSSITRRLFPDSVHHSAYTAAILATYTLLAALLWHRCWLLVTARRYDALMQERRHPDTTDR